jgi:uncharacterized membrane protein YdcZ (DUF606 family)
MKKVSKGLFLASVAIGWGIADALMIFVNVRSRPGHPLAGLMGASVASLLYGAIFMLMLWYKSWAAIQDGHARTTPTNAIVLLFIPLFNIYMIFQTVWGLSKDFNAYFQRHHIPAARLPEGLFLAFCVLCNASMIPKVGLVLLAVNYIVALIMVSALCDAINAVAGKAQNS